MDELYAVRELKLAEEDRQRVDKLISLVKHLVEVEEEVLMLTKGAIYANMEAVDDE